MYNKTMINKNKIQKKKTVLNTIADVIFKILIVIALVIFSYIIYDKADFSTNKLTFNSKKNEGSEKSAPSELKWFDDFRGIENVPSKNSKKEKESENTGFRYEGFKK